MSTLTVSERLGEALERVHALQAENDALLATRVEADRLTDANREIARLETICRRLETERFDAVARNARLETALQRARECAGHIASILADKRASDDSTIHAGNTAFISMERWAAEALATGEQPEGKQ